MDQYHRLAMADILVKQLYRLVFGALADFDRAHKTFPMKK